MGAGAQDRIRAIPIGLSPEDRQRRTELFEQFDDDNSGYLSLAKIDKGVRDVLKLPELFDAKPVQMRAYQAAKAKIKGKKPIADEYVTRGEFRYLLIYLRQYWDLWTRFQELDKSGDRRISEAQFIKGSVHFKKWGINMPNPKATFEELLKKNNAVGNLTFTQFCEWACDEHLNQYSDSNSYDD